jgi:hypothetical protein
LDRKAARLKAKEDKIQAALTECQRERQAIEEQAGALITDRKAKLEAQLQDIRVYRDVDRRNASMRKEQRRTRASAKERRSESDDEVLHNIDRSLHPLFHRVKAGIRETPLMSRTEEVTASWEGTHSNEYFAREYAKHLEMRGAPAPELEPLAVSEAASPRMVKAARKKGGPRRAGQVQPGAVTAAALRSLSAPEPTTAPTRPPARPTPAMLPASAAAPEHEEIITIRGERAQPLHSAESPELDEMMERAAIQGASWMAWKVGNLEILRRNGRLYIARPDAPLVTLEVPPHISSRTAVERWLDEEKPRRPFLEARAPEVAPAGARPEVTEERPAGVQVEERSGVVRVLFPDRPRVELRERLKRAGFRWNAPAWEAHATEEARAVAKEVAREAVGAAPVRTTYEEKRLSRVERMKTRALRAKQEAEATIERARKLAAVIPFGEPIHVGHHSENRDRRYRSKIHRTYDKGFRMLGEAEALEERAAGAERNAAISSDDPDAIQKLEAKLAELERVRALLPRARAILKKARTADAARPQLMALGLDEGDAARLTPGPPLQRWAASTMNQNLSGEIQRVRRRIADLQERAARGPRRPETFGDVRIVEEDNRVRIFFPGKPDEATRKALRSRGFLWAPSVGAWQRKATESAWFRAREILRGRAPAPAAFAAPAPVTFAPASEPEPWAEAPPPEAWFDDEPSPGEVPQQQQDPARSSIGTHAGTAERQIATFGAPAPEPAAPLVLAPAAAEPEKRRARGVPRTPPELQGPRRNLAFEDLNPWEMSAWERTPSLFGEAGPVPPPQPGEERAPKQKRLRF